MSGNHDDPGFSSLSLKDLIEARDLYHFHLMSKANVVGTAVGLYLVRSEESWPKERGEGAKGPPKKLTYPRTFGNSEVRDYSWPCILVLVREWIDEGEFGKKGGPAPWDVIPKRLILSDGRAVPVCTVLAPPVPPKDVASPPPIYRPAATFGGGAPILVEVQQQMHRATAGCLVSDGHTTYALTARHACGEPGTQVYAMLRGGLERVGVSSERQITRRLFSDVYPALPLRQTWLGLDVGLVRVDDANDWTPNTYRLPPIRPLFDIYEQNLSLRKLMDQPVVAVGAASGVLNGVIKALFYRYRSVGGYDYVSDFLIAPAEGEAGARHGDSGALWHLQMPGKDGKPDKRPVAERDLRPLAIEWGAQVFVDRAERSSFSLATGLSNICKLLDVELIVDAPDGASGVWGAVGHYSIATIAIELVKDKKLKAFLRANAESISLPLDELKKGVKNSELVASGFVALADIPDIVWKQYPSPHLNRKGEDIGVPGGRDLKSGGMRSTGPEHATHHCDADMPFKDHATLTEACLADPSLLTPAQWNAYYDTFEKKPDANHRGILPFRVWQFFERMKDYAKDEPAAYLAAAGILSHYIGDASQPLHGTTKHDGIVDEDPDEPRLSQRKDKQTDERLPAFRGEGVHSAFETNMINSASKKDLFPTIKSKLDKTHGLKLAKDGKEAAIATLQLMKDVADILPVHDIIDAYERSLLADGSHVGALWDEVGDKTADVMAQGARTLAMLWDAAWAEGGGADNPGEIDQDVLRELYENPDFVRSVTINDIMKEIKQPSWKP